MLNALHDDIKACELDSWISQDCHGYTPYITLHEHNIYAWPLCRPNNEQKASDTLLNFLKDTFGVKR
jgi:hypothetical protein